MGADRPEPEQRGTEGESGAVGGHEAEAEDSLLPAAARLALFYAVLSPRILQMDLGVDRARAERLMGLLAQRGVLGPVFVERTGARESLINMVNARAGDVVLPPAVPLARRAAGRAAVVVTAVGAAIGLAACVGVILSGFGLRVAEVLGLSLFSPSLAQVAGLLVLPAAAGWGLGALVERLLSPEDEVVPYGSLRIRRAVWSLYAAASIGFGAAQLFR